MPLCTEVVKSQVRIFIVDDHVMFREALCKLLQKEPDFQVVGEADNNLHAAAAIEGVKPDVLLLDMGTPRLAGMDLLQNIATSQATPRILLLSNASLEHQQLVQMLQLGVRGILTKNTASVMLFKSIRRVMAGEYWLGHKNISDLVRVLREGAVVNSDSSNGFGLTRRETEIVATVVDGLSNKEIASTLSISEQTVKHHLTRIYQKLGVSNRLELALFAINHRLISES